MPRLLLLTLLLVYGLCQGRAQTLAELNRLLDSVPYYELTDIDYSKERELPDTTRRKIVHVLNGYMPPRTCQPTDRVFPENFILAIGAWSVKEAEPILIANLNDARYPKMATLLALARMGNRSARDSAMRMLALRDTTFIDIVPRGYITNQRYNLFRAGYYLKSKELLFRAVDLLDVRGKAITFDGTEPVPVELLTIIDLSLCFLDEKYVATSTLAEWQRITDTFSADISNHLKKPRVLRKVLSKENKSRVKALLKDWIERYVAF